MKTYLLSLLLLLPTFSYAEPQCLTDLNNQFAALNLPTNPYGARDILNAPAPYQTDVSIKFDAAANQQILNQFCPDAMAYYNTEIQYVDFAIKMGICWKNSHVYNLYQFADRVTAVNTQLNNRYLVCMQIKALQKLTESLTLDGYSNNKKAAIYGISDALKTCLNGAHLRKDINSCYDYYKEQLDTMLQSQS